VDIINPPGGFSFLPSSTGYVLSYILNASKNVYPAPKVSATFIGPLETSYEISLFAKTLQSSHTSNWRSHGISFSTDSKCQSKAGPCIGVNYDGGGICCIIFK